MKPLNLTFFTAFILVILAFFIQLVLASNLSTKGGEIKQLEKRKETLFHEISHLENEVNKLSSLKRIKKEAQEELRMSFDAERVEYLEDLDVAYKE